MESELFRVYSDVREIAVYPCYFSMYNIDKVMKEVKMGIGYSGGEGENGGYLAFFIIH